MLIGIWARHSILWNLFRYPNNSQVDVSATGEKVSKQWPAGGSGRRSKPKEFRYMFVRDPFDRAISGYRNGLKNGWLKNSNMTFNEYLDFLVQDGPKDSHFDLQVTICDPCALNISFVGRAETMEDDMDYIINVETKMHLKVNFTAGAKGGLRQKMPLQEEGNSQILRSMNLTNLLSFLTSYRWDFMAFGYNPYATIKAFLDVNGYMDEQSEIEF